MIRQVTFFVQELYHFYIRDRKWFGVTKLWKIAKIRASISADDIIL